MCPYHFITISHQAFMCKLIMCDRFHTVRAGHGKGKKLMLMVHGFPELWYSWRHQMQAFKDDYEVVAFDLRGYGLTEKPKVRSVLAVS